MKETKEVQSNWNCIPNSEEVINEALCPAKEKWKMDISNGKHSSSNTFNSINHFQIPMR